MGNNILYYPAINLPNNPWTIKSILYWEEVGVIVPQDFIETPEQFHPRMRKLIQENAVTQYFPDHYDYIQYSISEAVLKVILNKGYKLPRDWETRRGAYWKIHNTKFSPDLFNTLTKLKLAEKLEKGRWYLVESKTASIMMSYLAAGIAKKIGHSPVTDRSAFIRPENHLALVANDKDRIRAHLLDDVMPYPQNASISQLLSFKDKYSEQLISFRKNIEDAVENSWLIKDEVSRDAQLKKQTEKINAKKEELIAKLKERGFGKVVLGAVKGMAVDVAIGIFTGDVVSPIGTIIGGTYEVVKEYKSNPIKGEDLAFIALLDHRLTYSSHGKKRN